MESDPTYFTIDRLDRKGGPKPIPLAEWLALVDRTQELRRAVGDEVIVNPFTQRPVARPDRGDAKFRSGTDWERVFSWRQGDWPMNADEGFIVFRTLGGTEPDDDPVHRLAVRLAAKLRAVVTEMDA